jgi:tetratricopeptide (TPR) repeat protein
MRTGNYAGASEANAKAAAIDEKYIKANNVKGTYPMMYYTHNLQFLAASAAMEGRSAVSRDAAKKTTAIVTPLAKDMPMAEFLVPFEMYYDLRFEKWDDVLALPAPDPSLPTATALWHFGRSMAFAYKQKLDDAGAEQKLFTETAAKIPPDAMMNLNSSKDLIEVAATTLEAKIFDSRGDVDQAMPAWRKAVAAADKLAYDEPPAWYFPPRESLGGALLRLGLDSANGEAEAVFREDLKRNPGNPRSLFGLAQSLRKQGKAQEAGAMFKQFRTAWAHADVSLTTEGL